MRKWIVYGVIVFVVYVLWRKFGGSVKDAITTATK